MWAICGIEKGCAFPDMARDENMHQIDFEDYEEAVKYGEEHFEKFSIELTSHTPKFFRDVMGVIKR